MKRDYWRASSKAIRHDGLMVRRGWAAMGFVLLVVFVIAFFASVSHAQVSIGNAYRVAQFRGATVGEKTTQAQNACSENTSIPCLIVFDPILAIYPTGSMPVKCSQCYWVDYRNPSALFGGGAGGVGSTANQQVLFNDNGSVGGSTCFVWNKLTNTFTVGCSGTQGIIRLPGSASGTYVIQAANTAANAVGVLHDDGTGVVTSSLIVASDVAVASRQGNGSKFLMAGTVAANAVSLCTDSGGNATTTGCVADLFTVPRSFTTYPAGNSGNWSSTALQTTEINGAGSPTGASGTQGTSMLYVTGATNNTTKGVAMSQAMLRIGDKLRLQHYFAYVNSPAGSRTWIVFTDQSAATMLAADNPAGNWVGFWHCNDTGASCDADVTTLQCVLKDGTTRNRIDSGVTMATGVRYGVEVKESPVGTWHFYVKDGGGALTEVCGTGTTTNAPTNGSIARWMHGFQNLDSGDERQSFEGFWIWSDR